MTINAFNFKHCQIIPTLNLSKIKCHSVLREQSKIASSDKVKGFHLKKHLKFCYLDFYGNSGKSLFYKPTSDCHNPIFKNLIFPEISYGLSLLTKRTCLFSKLVRAWIILAQNRHMIKKVKRQKGERQVKSHGKKHEVWYLKVLTRDKASC